MNKAIISIILLVCSIAFAQPPDEHTMAYWKIDEGSGDFVEDSSANGNHGTVEMLKQAAQPWNLTEQTLRSLCPTAQACTHRLAISQWVPGLRYFPIPKNGVMAERLFTKEALINGLSIRMAHFGSVFGEHVWNRSAHMISSST